MQTEHGAHGEQKRAPELVTFDPEESARLRLFTFLDGDYVERVLESRQAGWSEVLGLFWVVVEDAATGPMLRLSRDPEGTDLLPTSAEAERKAREAADRRVAALEAELAAIKGHGREG